MKIHTRCLSIILLLIVLALVTAPAGAAQQEAAMSGSELAIRQAHLAWGAYVTEVEMNAALAYLEPLYGTETRKLSTLRSQFRELEGRVTSLESSADYRSLLTAMKNVSSQFQGETAAQLLLGQRTASDLSPKITSAVTNNPYIEEKKNAYWRTRTAAQLKDFDAYAVSSQISLDTLNAGGYDTSKAQRTLDVIESKRPDLLAALEAKSEDRIVSVNTVISPLTQQLSQQAASAQGEVSEREKIQFLVDQGYRGVFRADTLNNQLVPILLDIGPAESILRKAKTDLAATSTLLSTGSLPLAKTPLTQAKKDFKDLSMAYRDLGNTADLPPEMTATLRSLVIVFDNTADQMEVS